LQFKRQKQAAIDVNLTPLIDVVFLLLIFFMVSTSFIKETHLTLNLPSAVHAQEVVQETVSLEVIIDSNGFYRIDGRALINTDNETLESALKNLSQGNLSTPLTVTADATAPYQAVVKIIDIAGGMGFTKINITTQPEAEG
jgi:biopolymer transport protein ExbD|tara:strand:+ start:570 stop:992 length:423 start_codon:yes stop_codon:yes gene_type:complete